MRAGAGRKGQWKADCTPVVGTEEAPEVTARRMQSKERTQSRVAQAGRDTHRCPAAAPSGRAGAAGTASAETSRGCHGDRRETESRILPRGKAERPVGLRTAPGNRATHPWFRS